MPRKAPPPRSPQLDIAGALCLAFVNTASARDKNRQLAVDSYNTLVTWFLQAGLVSAETAGRLNRQAPTEPEQTEATIAHALLIRDTLTRLFLARARGEVAPEDDLDVFNQWLEELTPPMRLVSDGSKLVPSWSIHDEVLDRMFWPILQSATELLTADTTFRRCAAPGCDLMFVDNSPRGPRRWCEAKTCGNRVKSLRYYHSKGKHSRGKDWYFR